MADLIDRQEAVDAFGNRPMIWTDSDYELGCVNQYDVDRLAIETVPTAAVQPVRHGHWIDETFKPTGLVFHPYVCDQCGCHSESNFTYCPDCGARMDGEKE